MLERIRVVIDEADNGFLITEKRLYDDGNKDKFKFVCKDLNDVVQHLKELYFED